MDGGRADISPFYLNIGSGNTCRRSSLAPFAVDDAPQIDGGQEEAFASALQRQKGWLLQYMYRKYIIICLSPMTPVP